MVTELKHGLMVHNTRVIGEEIKHVGKVNLSMQMEMCMKENG